MSEDKEATVLSSRCAACDATFVCGAQAGLPRCWCMEQAKGVWVPEAGLNCFCPACLQERINAQSASAG